MKMVVQNSVSGFGQERKKHMETENDISVLVVEDDQYISNFICMSLKQKGYQFIKTTTAMEAMSLFYANNPDVVILDLGLPDMDGIEVIEQIRKKSDRPIIVVSARQEESEKIKALDLGADDYVVKPFHMGELLARIRVAVRKSERGLDTNQQFICDYLTIDFSKRLVFIEGKEIHVTPIEYKLLKLFIANRGKVLTHNYIQHQIWGYGEEDPNSLRVFMATLRRKIQQILALLLQK